MNRDEAIECIKTLKALVELNNVSKILDTFYKAFHTYTIGDSDYVSLHGSMQLGATLSGRMSSNDPNLMQIPSTGTVYAKPVKDCFRAESGWIMVGADYASLEAKIDALVTKDPNKLRVYTEGMDSHAFNAYTYWPHLMPDIDGSSVESINTIPDKYKSIRQRSKTVSFALQYGGKSSTLVKNSGFPKQEALDIVARYERTYSVSMAHTADALKQASTDGYVTGAFGLRLRTPILGKTVLGQRSTPHEAEAEGRTAGNMLSQSYGMLNNRSTNAFMQKVWASEHKLSILPIAQIHDSSYYLVRNNLAVIKFVNDHLIEEMNWQDLPELKHPIVRLGGELSVFYPSWAYETNIPNHATLEQIADIGKQIRSEHQGTHQ